MAATGQIRIEGLSSGSSNAASSEEDLVGLPLPARLAIKLNERAFDHGNGFFFHLSGPQSSTRRDVSDSRLPDIVFTLGTWTATHKRNFDAATDNVRHHGSDFATFAPKASTSLWHVHCVDDRQTAIDLSSNAAIVILSNSSSLYCLSTRDLRTFRRHRGDKKEQRGNDRSELEIVKLPWVWEAPNTNVEKLQREALQAHRVEGYDGLYRKLVAYAMSSPPSFDSQTLLRRLPKSSPANVSINDGKGGLGVQSDEGEGVSSWCRFM